MHLWTKLILCFSFPGTPLRLLNLHLALCLQLFRCIPVAKTNAERRKLTTISEHNC
jgi:hypothetical protein